MNTFSRIENKLLAKTSLLINSLRGELKLPNKPTSISFVCTGNICRSAYAEGKLKSLLGGELEKGGLKICSAGLDTTPGKPANAEAIKVALARGIDLKAHKTTSFEADSESLVFCMEPWQKRAARSLAKNQPVHLLSSLNKQCPFVIGDPNGKSELVFNDCFDNIDFCLESLVGLLREK